MTEVARRRAERCFALARSTRFEGERDNAVTMGTRIAEEAGLDLDTFDIPGRAKVKTPPRSRFRSDLFEREHSPFFDGGPVNRDELNDIMERFRRHMAEGEDLRRKAAAERETRQAREEETLRERERAQTWATPSPAHRAASFLWSKGVRVYPSTDEPERLWIIPDESALEYTDAGIIEAARARGFERDNVKRAPFGDQLGDLAEAIYFLRARRFAVEAIPDSDYYSLREPGQQPEIVQARRVILSAKLRGFGS